MPSVDPMELVFVLAIVLIILRPRRLSEAGVALGRRMGLSEPLSDAGAPGQAAAPELEPRRAG